MIPEIELFKITTANKNENSNIIVAYPTNISDAEINASVPLIRANLKLSPQIIRLKDGGVIIYASKNQLERISYRNSFLEKCYSEIEVENLSISTI